VEIDKVHKINLDNFIVSKLTDEFESIEKLVSEAEASKGKLEENLADHRRQIEVLEKELYVVCANIAILKENKSAVKAKSETLKKDKK